MPFASFAVRFLIYLFHKSNKTAIDIPLFLSKLKAAFYRKGDLDAKNTNYKLVIILNAHHLKMMNRKAALWLLWVGFIAYILLLAPPLHLQETLTLLKNIFTLQWLAINPIILSLFSLVGIWLLIYSGLLFIDGRMQQIPF